MGRQVFDQAAAFREERTFRPKTYEELRAFLKDPGGFVEAPWCGSPECEDRVKADTKATIRFLPVDPALPDTAGGAACIVCGKPATEWAVWAQAY